MIPFVSECSVSANLWFVGDQVRDVQRRACLLLQGCCEESVYVSDPFPPSSRPCTGPASRSQSPNCPASHQFVEQSKRQKKEKEWPNHKEKTFNFNYLLVSIEVFFFFHVFLYYLILSQNKATHTHTRTHTHARTLYRETNKGRWSLKRASCIKPREELHFIVVYKSVLTLSQSNPSS